MPLRGTLLSPGLVAFILLVILAFPALATKKLELQIDPKTAPTGVAAKIKLHNAGDESISISSFSVTRPDGKKDDIPPEQLPGQSLGTLDPGQDFLIVYPDSFPPGSGPNVGLAGHYTIHLDFGESLEGSFTREGLGLQLIPSLAITPIPCSDIAAISLQKGVLCEETFITMDFETNARLSFDFSNFSGLADLGVGLTGLEFAILNAEVPLGPFDFQDTFAFATPFNQIHQAIGPFLFVKKRVNVILKTGGVDFENLAIFEDTNFPDPDTSSLTSYMGSDQAFHFGDIVSFEADLGGGITLGNITGFCADPQQMNKIKKRSWMGRACDSDHLEFTVEKILLSGLTLGALDLDSLTEFAPGSPFGEQLDAIFHLKIFDISGQLISNDISQMDFSKAIVMMSTPQGPQASPQMAIFHQAIANVAGSPLATGHPLAALGFEFDSDFVVALATVQLHMALGRMSLDPLLAIRPERGFGMQEEQLIAQLPLGKLAQLTISTCFAVDVRAKLGVACQTPPAFQAVSVKAFDPVTCTTVTTDRVTCLTLGSSLPVVGATTIFDINTCVRFLTLSQCAQMESGIPPYIPGFPTVQVDPFGPRPVKLRFIDVGLVFGNLNFHVRIQPGGLAVAANFRFDL
jgi:hypothetical protein